MFLSKKERVCEFSRIVLKCYPGLGVINLIRDDLRRSGRFELVLHSQFHTLL